MPRSEALQALDWLVGSWEMSGGITGQVRFRWAEGGHFLLQEVDLVHAGQAIRGLEIIGHRAKPGRPPEEAITSRFTSFLDGLTLDYIYEMTGDTLVIWFEDKALNNRMVSRFSPDGQVHSGSWSWPGGGYSFSARRIGAP